MSDARWERIKAVFNAAIDRHAAERDAFLNQECGDDAELRREVESLLDKRTQEAVRTGGAAEVFAGASVTAAMPLMERPGTKIGVYKLLQKIGEGGFGVVFMSEQDVPVRRRVAVKVIKPGRDTREVVARFEQERQALALMDHPNIAKVLDAGATPLTQGGGGRPYFVMEYVIGDPITVFADAHKLSVRGRLELFTQVCSAVQHAHMKGVIHRDLKPRNVLVSMVDGRPHAKVIDFGIAKATGARLTDKTLFTEHRQLIGTPEYMSPEQAEGSPDIDTRTDVYSLGVLLYELLTGATPFDGERLRSAAWGEMQRIIREEEPPMPSVRLSKAPLDGEGVGALRAEVADGEGMRRVVQTLASVAAARGVEPANLGTQLKGELDWIVMKALDKDRARRYESPNQLGADVQRHLAGEAVVAAPVSRMYRFRKFVRKNKGPVLAGSAVAVALSFSLTLAMLQFTQNRRALRIAELQRLANEELSDIDWGEKYQNVPIDNLTPPTRQNESPEESLARELVGRARMNIGLLGARNAQLQKEREKIAEAVSALAESVMSQTGRIHIMDSKSPYMDITTGPSMDDLSTVRIRRTDTPEKLRVVGVDREGKEVPPSIDQSVLAINTITSLTLAGLKASNDSLTSQRDAAKSELLKVAAELQRIGNGRGHIGIMNADYDSTGLHTFIDFQPHGSGVPIIYSSQMDERGSTEGFPRHEATLPDTITLFGSFAMSVVHDVSKAKQAAESANASLIRQRDIAREAVYEVSKATNCDVCDELGARSVADAWMHGWMNGPSGAAYKDAPEEERQLRALADFSIYNAKRLFEETRRARLAEAEVRLSEYSNWETAPRDKATEPLVAVYNTRKELLGDSNIDTIKALWMLGALQFEKGDLDHGLTQLRLSVTNLEASSSKQVDLLAAMYDNLLHAELVMGNLDAATSVMDRLRALIASDEALNGVWTISGYGPFKPHFFYTPRLFTWQDAFVQTTHAKAIEIMREKLSHLDRSVLESRYASVVRDWALNAVIEPGDPNWAQYLKNVKHRATFTATSLAPTDPEAQTALALALYRSGEYAKALPLIRRAIELRSAQSSEASPIAAAAEAMICFRLGDETHISQARAALARAKDLQSDLMNIKPGAQSSYVKVILAEAEALINGVQPK